MSDKTDQSEENRNPLAAVPAQAGLGGELAESVQGKFADVPEDPGESTIDRAENPGGLLADERAEEEVGRNLEKRANTEQRTFRDPKQETLDDA